MAEVLDKQQAHDLIDQLTPEQVPPVVTFLQSIVTSTDDDEPVTEEDIQRCREAKAAIARGEGTSMEDMLAEFGLTMADFPLDK
jgi:hypothetical protein